MYTCMYMYMHMYLNMYMYMHVNMNTRVYRIIQDIHVTILLAHDPLSSLAYPMITHRPPIAGNSPTCIKNFLARQQPTSTCIIHVHDTQCEKDYTVQCVAFVIRFVIRYYIVLVLGKIIHTLSEREQRQGRKNGWTVQD